MIPMRKAASDSTRFRESRSVVGVAHSTMAGEEVGGQARCCDSRTARGRGALARRLKLSGRNDVSACQRACSFSRRPVQGSDLVLDPAQDSSAEIRQRRRRDVAPMNDANQLPLHTQPPPFRHRTPPAPMATNAESCAGHGAQVVPPDMPNRQAGIRRWKWLPRLQVPAARIPIAILDNDEFRSAADTQCGPDATPVEQCHMALVVEGAERQRRRSCATAWTATRNATSVQPLAGYWLRMTSRAGLAVTPSKARLARTPCPSAGRPLSRETPGDARP